MVTPTALPSPAAVTTSPIPRPSSTAFIIPTLGSTITIAATNTAVLPTPQLATATPTTAPTATADPYAGLSIADLEERDYGGGLLQIEETLEKTDTFARYLISYPSDGLKIYGYMNVPNEGVKFPVVILLHGYINPTDYETLAYTRRYADSLVESGYFVIHPNLRNYPPSDKGPNPFRIGYAVDALNLIAIIREQSQDITGTLRRADANDINLWGHSMGGGVVLRVITVNNEDYIKTAVLYGSMSGDEVLNFQRILGWSGGSQGSFELNAPQLTIKLISPIYHLDRIRAAVSIHHSAIDDVVPIEWSIDLCDRLKALEHPTECFTYYYQPHTFRGDGDALFMERVIDFFDNH